MAKNAAPRPKSANGASSDAAAEQPESLDQVRDILFGGQMRMVDTRLRGLEERIALEHTTLRNDLTRKIGELEEASKKEFAAQAERLSAERLTSELDRAASSLRADKVDTTTLAGTLTEMAARLTGGGRAPGKGSGKS